jgi:hypothetical protein
VNDNRSAAEWLHSMAKKAIAASLGQEPSEVIIRRATVAAGAKGKGTHRVRAWVRMAERSYEISVSVTRDGGYGDFQIIG